MADASARPKRATHPPPSKDLPSEVGPADPAPAPKQKKHRAAEKKADTEKYWNDERTAVLLNVMMATKPNPTTLAGKYGFEKMMPTLRQKCMFHLLSDTKLFQYTRLTSLWILSTENGTTCLHHTRSA